MVTRDEIRQLVVDEVRIMYPENKAEIGDTYALFGGDGIMDSIALVNFVADMEYSLQTEKQLPVTIANGHAMSQSRSPFRTVGSVTDYLMQLIGEKNG